MSQQKFSLQEAERGLLAWTGNGAEWLRGAESHAWDGQPALGWVLRPFRMRWCGLEAGSGRRDRLVGVARAPRTDRRLTLATTGKVRHGAPAVRPSQADNDPSFG